MFFCNFFYFFTFFEIFFYFSIKFLFFYKIFLFFLFFSNFFYFLYFFNFSKNHRNNEKSKTGSEKREIEKGPFFTAKYIGRFVVYIENGSLGKGKR